MLLERINLILMNRLYKVGAQLGSRVRSSIIFGCCIIICAVFSFQPKSVHDERRMILFSVLVLLMITALTDRKPEPVRWRIPLAIPIELFSVAIIATIPMHPVGGSYFVFALDILFLFPMLYLAVINSGKRAELTDAVAASAILMGTACFVYSVILIRSGKDVAVEGRMAGAISNPNYYGMVGLVMLISCIYLVQRINRNKVVTLQMVLVVGMSLSMMIKAISRTAIISSFFCFVLFLIYLRKSNREDKENARKRLIEVLVFILISALTAAGGVWLQSGANEAQKQGDKIRSLVSEATPYVFYTVYADDGNEKGDSKSFWERFDFTGENADAFTSGRTAVWRTYGVYLNLTGNDYDSMFESGQIPMRAHNNPIEYAFRFGIPAGILYLIFYIAIIVRAAITIFKKRQIKPEDLWVVMVVSSYALYSMVEISTLPFTRYIPCLFFLSIAPLMCSQGGTDYEGFNITEGVGETILYVTDIDGNSAKAHTLRISNSSDVRVTAACSEGLLNGEPARQNSLSSIVKRYNELHKGSDEVIAAFSGDFYNLKTGAPCGALVMSGRIMNAPGKKPFFAVCNDGTFAIRKADEGIDDVAEAVGGRQYLLKKGKIKAEKSDDKQPRQAVGICKDGSLLIVNIEGRQPDSRGVSLYDLAVFMKKTGCTDAINLDGGGSAGFMTKRPEDEEPVFRNIPGDGYERNIASAIFIVKRIHQEKQQKESGPEKNTRSSYSFHPGKMSDKDTYLDKTLSGRYVYMRNGRKPSGLFNIDGSAYLFKDGKGATDSIRIGKIEYGFRKGKYRGSSDPEAGDVVFGYCGADEDGRNLIFALHKGNWLLNIGLKQTAEMHNDTKETCAGASGEMEDWGTTQESRLPWYAFRHRIRSVYIADGVTSIGSRFLYMPKGKVKGRTETPQNELSQVRLPESLKVIGEYAFYNKPLIKKVKIPSNNVKIKNNAFDTETELQID